MEEPGNPFVRAEGLGRRYGDKWAARNVSFRVDRGEIFGFIGPNGAGKTTTLKMLCGLLTPSEGSGKIAGLAISDASLRPRIGYLPEESPLYEDMTPVQYLRFFADLYAVPRKVSAKRIEDLLTNLQLDVRHEKRIGDLSKGMRRKVAIARSLVHDPDLLIYDEPASGLDPVATAYVLDLVRELRAEGKTILFSAHNLYHVERICDRILVLHQGQPILHGTMDEIRKAAGGTEYRVRLSVPVPGSAPADGGHEVVVREFSGVAKLEAEAKARGGRLIDVRSSELPLEDIFLKATSSDGRRPDRRSFVGPLSEG